MNIHEHQAKEILKEFGAPVSKGVVIFSVDEIEKKIVQLDNDKFVLKAQIHAGGIITDFEGNEISYGKKNFKNPSLILKSKDI